MRDVWRILLSMTPDKAGEATARPIMAPVAWQDFGEWALAGQHGMRPIYLSVMRGKLCVRDEATDRRVALTPDHPIARQIVESHRLPSTEPERPARHRQRGDLHADRSARSVCRVAQAATFEKMKPHIPKPAEEQRKADLFNLANNVGTVVRYSEVLADGIWPPIETIERKTRGRAWLMGGHTAVVLLEGKSGAVALSHCEVVT